MKFNGPDYIPSIDASRLSLQSERIKDLMLDGVWRTVDEVCAILGEKNSRSVDAQLRHLRKIKFGSYRVTRRNRSGIRGLSEYQVLEPIRNYTQLTIGFDTHAA